jgi:2-dehydropantoate 2-reductase
MASLFGARLARAGHAVTLAGAWHEGLAALARDGVRVEEPGGAWTARVDVAGLDAPLAPRDLVLVLVKSHQTQAVAPAAARAAGISGWVVTLQNGLGNRERLEAEAGRGRVGLGVTSAGATLLGPGRVRPFPAPTVLADDEGGRARVVAGLFTAAGLECGVEPDIDRMLWRKLVANCAINPLSAVAGVPNGALLERPEWRETLRAAALETAAVARALGIEVGDAETPALETAARTAGNRSSMLQDLSRGARTEIDALNGAVVELGQRLGVPTPVNKALANSVRERERSYAGSPR